MADVILPSNPHNSLLAQLEGAAELGRLAALLSCNPWWRSGLRRRLPTGGQGSWRCLSG